MVIITTNNYLVSSLRRLQSKNLDMFIANYDYANCAEYYIQSDRREPDVFEMISTRILTKKRFYYRKIFVITCHLNCHYE